MLSRLLACLTFKDVAAVLAHRLEANDRYVARHAGLDDDIAPAPPAFELPVGVDELATIAQRALSIPDAPDVDHLDLELPSVGDAIKDLRMRMAHAVESDFEDVVAHCTRSVDVVAYFLAVLELARWGIVRVVQEDRHAPILLRYDAAMPTEGLQQHLAAEGEA